MDIDIIGTPDEEAMGCKVDYVQCRGCSKEYDFAIMVHLDGEETRPNSQFLALDCFRAKYHGKPAHAAGEPWNGINAVNGVQLCHPCYGYDAPTSCVLKRASARGSLREAPHLM